MRYKKITSLSNPLIKEALKEKRSRLLNTLTIEGNRLLEMALASGADVGRVFFTESYRSKNEDFFRQVAKHATELIETTEQIITRLSDTETPQGIAVIVSYKPHEFQELSLASIPLIAVSDGIQDPGNLGTLIRTVDAAGADALIMLPGTCDPFTPKAVRATAGSVFNIPVLFAEPEQLVGWLREKSISLAVSDVHASKTIYDADLRKPLAFIFGNEAAGVSDYLKRKSDMRVSIPIPGKAESLNVVASAAICLFEAVRQRRGRPQSAG